MIELIVGDGKPLQNASIPIRWCINAETLNKIKEDGGQDAQILIVSIDSKGGEERALVPLSQGMTYFDIRRPGESTIFAHVIWAQPGVHLTALKNLFLVKSGGSYDYSIVYSREIRFDERSEKYQVFKDNTKIIVDIPAELFGKEPPEWFKSYINLWSSREVLTSMVDECSWRRRVIMFFLIKFWVILGYVAIVEFIAGLWAIGSALFGFTMNYKLLRHPLTRSLAELSDGHRSYLINPKGKNEYSKHWKLLFTPIYLIVSTVSVLAITHGDISAGYLILSGFLLATIGIPVIVTMVILFLLGCGKILSMVGSADEKIRKTSNSFSKFIGTIYDKFDNWTEDRRITAAKERYEESYKYLTCVGPRKIATISEVPMRDRTAKLIFQAVKNKVCKPMPK